MLSPRVLLGLLVALPGAAFGNDRVRIRFDDDWRFFREPNATVSATRLAWRWRTADVSSLSSATLPADLDNGQWARARVGQDVFRGRSGFVWFTTDLGHDPANKARMLHFESVDDNAAVFLNGRRLAVHDGWNDPFDVKVAGAWNDSGPNTLVVLDENTAGGGGIMGTVEFQDPPGPEVVPPESNPGFDDHAWRSVHLPHDFVVEGTFDPHGDVGHGSLPPGEAWYRKTFILPAAYRGRSAWIDFDGVYRDAAVWLNGHKLGNHACGYGSFRYDLGPAANYGGKNVLAIHVDARKSEGWWYEGGGIYRHVWLNFANPVHVRPWGTFVTSSLPDPKGAETSPADLTLQTDVDNDSRSGQSYEVESDVLEPSGRILASTTSSEGVRTGVAAHVVQKLHLVNARLWSIESPNLYRLRTRIREGASVIDETTTTFGVRAIRFDPNEGFFLNGKAVKIKGTCNHQDHAGVGIAVPDSLFRFRVGALKKMGSNAYRCSHNPPAQELLDECDRQGMIVMDESRHLGDTERGKASVSTPYSELAELKAMVLRDRNHPSIVMWSMCNEEGIQTTEAGTRIFSAMMKATKALDPTRPVTCAMNFGMGTGISAVEDLQGFNYSVGGYDRFHQEFPNQPVFGSETASAVSTRGIYANDPARGYVSAYDTNRPGWGNTAQDAWMPIATRPWMAGGFVWTGFDYKGEPTPYGWPCINSHFGIMDICGFPKDSYYYYQAWWGEKPVVHILPHWNWTGKEGQLISVWCHSNADRVDLFLNGRSLGAKNVPKFGHVEWTVNYRPGQLVAKGYRGSDVIAIDKVETTGPPDALRLSADQRRLPADGEDVSEVKVEVVDAQGRVVPNAANLVQFSVRGSASIVGVGNGDPSSHEPDKASERHTFNGLCMALVGAASSPGTATLVASSPGLKSANLRLSFVRSDQRWVAANLPQATSASCRKSASRISSRLKVRHFPPPTTR